MSEINLDDDDDDDDKHKRQPIGMLGRSSGNHDWLLAIAFEWKPGFSYNTA